LGFFIAKWVSPELPLQTPMSCPARKLNSSAWGSFTRFKYLITVCVAISADTECIWHPHLNANKSSTALSIFREMHPVAALEKLGTHMLAGFSNFAQQFTPFNHSRIALHISWINWVKNVHTSTDPL
jgi:hypothetical protein